jgi:hypothetical protein
MPIFQDDFGSGRAPKPSKPTKTMLSTTPPEANLITRKASEESIRTDLCEGPVQDTPEERNLLSGDLNTTFRFPLLGTSDRTELIERLKRGESPTWLPNRNVWIPSLQYWVPISVVQQLT